MQYIVIEKEHNKGPQKWFTFCYCFNLESYKMYPRTLLVVRTERV